MSAVGSSKDKWRRRVCRGVLIFATLIAGALIWIWCFHDAQRQDKWIYTAASGFAAYAGFLVWVLFGSLWRARMRWTIFVGTIASILFCRFGLRIHGVTGDLIPIVEWRWKAPRIVSVERGTASQNSPAREFTNSYPQFLGPNRNGVLPGPALARDWKRTTPRELWRHAVGSAWSGLAIQGRGAVTQEQRGEDELVVCYDLASGREVWSHIDKAHFKSTIAGEGPRATPTIVGNRVYSIGGAGALNCLDLATGQTIWTTNTLVAYGARLPEWGVACSPLVNDRAVIVTIGGRSHALVAYEKNSGAVLWASGQDDPHWSSPVHVTLDGVPQIVVFSENVSGYDEQTGAVLWQYPWRSPHPHVSVPVVVGNNRLLVSQGYGGGSELIEVARENERWHTQRIWKSIRLKSKFGTLVQLHGFVYGLDDGALACIDVNTGELKWKGDRYGHGQMILVGDLLLLMAESGEIVLLEPNPTEQRELARFKVFNAKTWNPPALAGDLLVVRNDREAACLRLPLAR